MISNCGHDERGKYSGGKAGDQGGEYTVKNWYNRPWTVILRHPDPKVGQKIANIARGAANNDKVGYDQNERGTFYTQLKKADWFASKITKACEADCSSSTSAVIIAAGHRLGLKKLIDVKPYNTTSTLKADLKKAGFKALTNKKYLESQSYLLPGDILLYEGHHVAINLDKGNRA